MNHVVPVNDLREHVTNGDPCPCLPMVFVGFADGEPRTVHNSYDRRETGEVCRRALDLLGTALANHGHEWTMAERTAYEHAIHVLAMHWPEKPSEPNTWRPS